MAAVVQARGLTRRYGRVRALEAVDVEIGAGEIVGLLGPSGAGKTTLVRILALLQRPSSGALALFGEDHAPARPARFRRRIGYMPQEHALYEDLSARFNVHFFGHGAPADRVDGMLRFLGLGDRAGDAVQTMSGGMKQRVSLACALVGSPELLLLDEPTAGIDPLLRERFWSEFRHLRDGGASLLVSTHQVDEAVHCDRLLLLREGGLVADTTPQALMRRVGTTARVERADGCVEERRFPPGGRELVAWLRTLPDAEADRVDVATDTLEDVIVGLMREQAAHA